MRVDPLITKDMSMCVKSVRFASLGAERLNVSPHIATVSP